MAMPFIQAKGYVAGKLIEGDAAVEIAKKILEKAEKEKVEIVLPVDFLTASKVSQDEEPKPYDYDALPADVYALDIGKKSIDLFTKELGDCSVCVWNGPLGLFEWDAYCHGTFEIAKAVSTLTEKNQLISIAGGGETSQALEDVHIRDGTAVHFTHISTGGGASLEMLEGKQLPAFTVFRSL
uniref:Phosphoglycerate kinase n=1 Tax=Lygus hesperus TaxID=30085 RepID=A0A0A9XN80_LYGHE